MDFLEYIIEYGLDNTSVLEPLGDKALDMGISIRAYFDNQNIDTTHILRDVKNHEDDLYRIGKGVAKDKDGYLLGLFEDYGLFKLEFDGFGNHKIHLLFLEGKATDFFTQFGAQITERRRIRGENYSEEEINDLTDVASEFLAGREGKPFSYMIYAQGAPFLEGVLDGDDFNLQLLDPMVYFKMLLFLLKGARFMDIKLRNPFDLLKLFEGIQGWLWHLGTSFKLSGIQFRAGLEGQNLLMAGRDVKPNFTSIFGPINIQLDSLFKIISSIFSKI